MQFKSFFITLASAAAVAVAAPAGILDVAAAVDASSTTANATLTTALTTDTFTASKVLQSFMKVDPFRHPGAASPYWHARGLGLRLGLRLSVREERIR
ncbi:hypothetical protein VTO73DRAFT_11408 [Trametes versicolor]